MTAKRIVGQQRAAAPWDETPPTQPEFHAIKALVQGKATDHQQGLVVEWLTRATGVLEPEFSPDSDRASNHAAGKRWVGLQFFRIAKARLAEPTAAPKGNPA